MLLAIVNVTVKKIENTGFVSNDKVISILANAKLIFICKCIT